MLANAALSSSDIPVNCSLRNTLESEADCSDADQSRLVTPVRLRRR
jgi:hypothetical protein